jgi:glycosyltransferase involved in cell wall biosynthesis
VNGLVVGINASRARSGGARAHLRGMLGAADPAAARISRVHVWCFPELAETLPARPWLQVHTPSSLSGNLLSQLHWERRHLPRELRREQCDIVLNVDAGTVCAFSPAVTMSRDMLSYEPGEIDRFGLSVQRLRLVALRFVQNASLRRAEGAVFLTQYAATVIQQSCGPLSRVALIPHGLSQEFFAAPVSRGPRTGPLRALYVSNIAPYKHHWYVVDGVKRVRDTGIDMSLTLTGGGHVDAISRSQARLDQAIAAADPDGVFVKLLGFVAARDLPALLREADLFIFASSCENMPNTLLEAMASGLPIACADRGPMPEVLGDGGLYFNPEDPSSIAEAVRALAVDPAARERYAHRARELAAQYSWKRCADETFAFLADTARPARRPQ